MEEVQHFSHEHLLNLYEGSEEKAIKGIKLPMCSGCLQFIDGPAYFCESCDNFWLHKSCIELPVEIQHPFHSSHPLTLVTKPFRFSKFFICDECRDLSSGFAFHCETCEFNLDIKCAIVLTDPNGQSSRGNIEKVSEISHFSHHHNLTNFNAREELKIDCSACELPLSGPASGCLRCYFFLHSSCKEIPQQIQHPYHPLHPLHVQVSKIAAPCCRVCMNLIHNLFYFCFECDFNLHIQCAKNALGIRSSLKHKCHEHELYFYLSSDPHEFTTTCKVCSKKCKGPCYLCIKCFHTYFHFECMPLPQTVEHECHFHPLILVDSFVEDDSGEYYCDACEKKRDPRYPVCCCKECPDYIPFIAHIECVVFEFADETEASSSKTVVNVLVVNPIKQNEKQKGDIRNPVLAEFDGAVANAQCKRQIGIEDSSNDHILTFEGWSLVDAQKCYSCRFVIIGPRYKCQFCKIYFHKSCAELPLKIRHHLHPSHTLSLFPPHHPSATEFICDGCRSFNDHAASYQCDECRFMLDIECASLGADQCEKLKVDSKVVKISHFIHKHELTFVNCVEQLIYKCQACELPILGSTYCCLDCRLFLHEICLEIPQETQHLYHPQHLLLVRDVGGLQKQCGACNSIILGIAGCCDDCNFYLHLKCANYLTSTLKHECHEHNLFCFMAEDSSKYFNCKVCGYILFDSFYRCVQCDLNLCLECIPLPLEVKQECHFDSLTLMKKVVEDDSGEYYCEVCEKKRNPNHPVYFCEECGDYIAHIGCVIYEVDASLEVLSWITDQESCIGETSAKIDSGTVFASDSEETEHWSYMSDSNASDLIQESEIISEYFKEIMSLGDSILVSDDGRDLGEKSDSGKVYLKYPRTFRRR